MSSNWYLTLSKYLNCSQRVETLKNPSSNFHPHAASKTSPSNSSNPSSSNLRTKESFLTLFLRTRLLSRKRPHFCSTSIFHTIISSASSSFSLLCALKNLSPIPKSTSKSCTILHSSETLCSKQSVSPILSKFGSTSPNSNSRRSGETIWEECWLWCFWSSFLQNTGMWRKWSLFTLTKCSRPKRLSILISLWSTWKRSNRQW